LLIVIVLISRPEADVRDIGNRVFGKRIRDDPFIYKIWAVADLELKLRLLAGTCRFPFRLAKDASKQGGERP